MSTLDRCNYWDDFSARVNDTARTVLSGSKPGLSRLTVHLTKACNFRCEYCNMCFQPKMMPLATAKKIVDEMPQGTIHFTGGEPTIIPYLAEICAYAKAKGLTVSLNTNGFKRIDVSNVDKLKASFDTGNREMFNRMVGAPAFDTVVSNYKHYSLKMKRKMFSITAVLSKLTYRDMLPLAQFVYKKFKVHNLYYSAYKGINNLHCFAPLDVNRLFAKNIPETLKFFTKMKAEYSRRQLTLYTKEDFALTTRFPSNYTTPCYLQLSEMVVDVNGVCHDCSHLYRDGVITKTPLNVNDTPLLECFTKLKNVPEPNNTLISKKCLTGCNRNLCGFNRTVHKELTAARRSEQDECLQSPSPTWRRGQDTIAFGPDWTATPRR